MAAVDESQAKYSKLVYIEFLEFFCRVAATLGPNGTIYDPVEQQVYQLLKILIERRYAIGRDTKETMPLREIIKDHNEDDD